MPERVIVVGGGLAGLLAAQLRAQRGDDVLLIEREGHCGGLLRSFKNEHGVSFDYGTHVAHETGNHTLDALLYDDVDSADWHSLSPLRAGNYWAGKLNQHSPFVDVRELPQSDYSRGIVSLLESISASASGNLSERLRAHFGHGFAEQVFEPIVKKLCGVEASSLHCDAAHLFGLTRVVALNAAATRLLKQLPALDDRLAFHSFHEAAASRRAFYPRAGGIERVPRRLREQAERAGARVRVGTQLSSIEHAQGRLQSVVLGDGECISCDRLIWTVPVPLLLRAAGLPLASARPRFRFTTLFHFSFDQPFESDLHYVTVYEPTMRSFRVTLYPNLRGQGVTDSGPFACTVEVLDAAECGPSIMDDVQQELVALGIVGSGSHCTYRKRVPVGFGFPVLDAELVAAMESAQESARQLSNVQLLGKAAGRSFFMSEVLLETYAACASG